MGGDRSKCEDGYARCDKIGIDGFDSKTLQSGRPTEAIAAALAARAQKQSIDAGEG
jgi:hypothetical protein